MKARETVRPQCPFEALLAVSGTFETAEASRSSGKAKIGRIQSKVDVSSAGQSEFDSADNTILGGAYAEGVGTSGGGESGDTDLRSEDSENSRASKGLNEEVSECKSSREGSESSRSRTTAAAKKQRMVWTIELHKRFLNAVNHLGMDNAVPKVILKMMNVDGITRENVASHLQKYRLHLRHQAGSQTSKVDGKRAAQHGDRPGQHFSAVGLDSVTKGLPLSTTMPLLPHPSTAGHTALGFPLNSPLAPYQRAGSLIVGNPCEHIPPQAWAAGVPGYDALQKLALIPEDQKASLLKDLTEPRPSREDLACQRPHKEDLNSAALKIAPLTTAQPAAAEPQ